jgi:alginate O-acetyltransferase complex protein AlgI
MLFNSLNFVFFLPVVFTLYWAASKKGIQLQNIILLLASYFFYASWDFRFLFLLMFSTLLDYASSLMISNASGASEKKFWLRLSICINLGFLATFKYFNFFTESFAQGLTFLGIDADFPTLKVLLPLGISFYTFHGLSYVLDIYKNKISPEKNLVNYSVFVSFFPLLVAGPIERATHLLPQVQQKRIFNYSTAVDGLRQILWGFFKKLVIADNCAVYANNTFINSSDLPGSTLAIGAFFFAMQIYCDFSGYSDIAIGTARLFGIELLRNFAYPYFSRSIAEFWRRWHISLSSWFRDYLYIPLGGSKRTTLMTVRNILIVFLVSGFWHGANWTFIFWGLVNALFILPSVVLKKNRNNLDIVAQGKILPSAKEVLAMAATFFLTVFAWIFFRAENMEHAFDFIAKIFSSSLFTRPESVPKLLILFIVSFTIVEWLGREEQYAIKTVGIKWPKIFRWSLYIFIVFLIGMFMYAAETPFIYFQF